MPGCERFADLMPQGLCPIEVSVEDAEDHASFVCGERSAHQAIVPQARRMGAGSDWMVQSVLVEQRDGDSRDLQDAWRGPRWWQRLHGMDPDQYGKWLAREVVFCGLVAIVVGSLLLASDKIVVLGALITALGVLTTFYGVVRLRRIRM